MITPLLWLDYRRCQWIIQRHSASFYRAFSLLNDEKRKRGIYAVYAFCRYVDDLIDEHNNLDALHAYKNQLDWFVKGYPVKGFRWRALADTRKHFYQSEAQMLPFYEMMEGQEFDAHPVAITSVKQLYQYCDLVAGSVGKMLLPILAPLSASDLTPFAIALGRAFQITNILRDVGEDFRRNRRYLPLELMDKYHVDISIFSQEKISDEFILLWEDLAHRAEAYYLEASKMIPQFPEDTRFPLLASLTIYKEILTVIRNARYTVFQTKHFVKDFDKMRLIQDLKRRGSYE